MIQSELTFLIMTMTVYNFAMAGITDSQTLNNLPYSWVKHEDAFAMRMGIFIHWAGPGPSSGTGILLSNGTTARDIDQFADSVNIDCVAEEIATLGFEYVILTDFHGLGTTLHPCTALDRWRGSGYTSKRDVVGEMIAKLKEKGIRVILFTHPLDGHDYLAEQREKLGWNDPNGNYRRWNDFINDVYAEIVERYGNDIAGIGFDSDFGLSGNAEWDGKLDLKRLRQTILSRCPTLNLFALAGPNDTCELGMKEVWRPSWLDPWMTRSETDYNVETWPAYRRLVTVVQANHWATITPPSDGFVRLTEEQLFRYTVLQSGVATEGPGVAWAASPYTDGTWERSVKESFVKFAQYVAPVAESLRGVYTSTSYPVSEGTCISNLPHGIVATRKIDDTIEYIHVLNPPIIKTLNLPKPADGKQFTSALMLKNNHPVNLTYNEKGIQLTLMENDDWDSLDTVIKLIVVPSTLSRKNLSLHKPVIASSSIESDQNWPPKSDWGRIRLVDGQKYMSMKSFEWSSGNFGWSSDRLPINHEEWVGVDLGAEYMVDTIRIYPRDDGDNKGYGFPINFSVQVSTDGTNWTTVASCTNVPKPSGVQSLSFTSTNSRFIRLLADTLRSNPNDDNLYSMQLVEIEVFGSQ
jgi:hypothetical protein